MTMRKYWRLRQITRRLSRIRELSKWLSGLHRAERGALSAAAVFYGVLVGLVVAAGDYQAVAWATALSIGLIITAARFGSDSDRAGLVALVALTTGIHMAAAVAIYSLAPHGFITGDDASYFRLASQAARFLQGGTLDPSYTPPFWGGDAYLFGGFVYLETALFVIFGPDVRMPLLLNSAMAVMTTLLIYSAGVRLFGTRIAFVAAAVVAFYPSLILWSSLNLKDSLTIALATSAVWALIAFAGQPAALSMMASFVATEALVSVRAYVAGTVAVAAALSIAVVAMPWRRRVMSATVGFTIAVAIVLQSLAAVGLGEGDQLLATFERVRAAMAVSARTAFVPTPSPQPSASRSKPAATTSAATIGPSAAPVGSSAVMPVATALTTQPATVDTEAPTLRTLSYLPVGLAYVIFAPVPFAARRAQELISAPEMAWWYVLFWGALFTLWRRRRAWRTLAPLVLVTAGLMMVLALTEGNVGTLFRHRGMVVPFVALLAAPAMAEIASRVTVKWRGSSRRA